MSAANDFVDVIRDLIQQELSKRDSTTLCEVLEQVSEDHYNLCTVSDPDRVIHNVVNMTKFTLNKGDYVYVYSLNGQLNNSFVCYKIIPYIAPAITEGSMKIETDYSIHLPLNKEFLFDLAGTSTPTEFMSDLNNNGSGRNLVNYANFETFKRSWYRANGNKLGYWNLAFRGSGSGEIILDLSSMYITQLKLTLSNGFIVGYDGMIIQGSNSQSLSIFVFDQHGERIDRYEQGLDSISTRQTPGSIPLNQIIIGDGVNPIGAIMFNGSSNGSINLYEVDCEYTPI